MSPLRTIYSLTVYLILFICILCTSQNTICVWNSHNSRDQYNGEYTLAAATQLNQPYWTKSSPTCATTTHYLMYVQDSYGDWWMIGDSLQPAYIDGQPYCEKPTPSNPTLCTAGWHYWYSGSNYGQLSMTVTDGSCPTLECNKIKLSNTGYNQCDKVFVKDNNMNNVFVNGVTYLYFNKQTFKWYCSDTLGDECSDDNSITHFYISSQNDNWFNINVDQSVQWTLNTGNTATFECIGDTKYPTTQPTHSPTKYPTQIPSVSPLNPTAHPLQSPTNIPSVNPSRNPTAHPTFSPTKYPTKMPSISPLNSSKNPTVYPTIIPTLNPSNNPSSYPTKMPTLNPNVTSSTNPTLYPTEIVTPYPSSNPTQSPLITVNEHSVEEIKSTIDNAAQDSNKAESANNNLNLFGINMNIILYILIGCILLCLIVFACILYLYCRIRKQRKHITETRETNINNNINNCTQKQTENSINLCDFAIATTPNLNAINDKLSEINQIDLNGRIKIGSIASVTSIDSNFQLQNEYVNEEDEGDELYTMDLNRHVTVGQDDNIVTKGNENDCDQMYINNNNNDNIVTVGMDDQFVTAGI